MGIRFAGKKKKFFFHRSPNFPTRRRDDSRVRAEEYLNCHLAAWPSDSQFTIIAVTDKSLIISSFNRFKLVSSKFEERGDLGKEKRGWCFNFYSDKSSPLERFIQTTI